LPAWPEKASNKHLASILRQIVTDWEFVIEASSARNGALTFRTRN
jgi:hypothetical protein